MVVTNNCVVSIEYTVRERGVSDILDTNKGGVALEFLVGAGQVIIGLEEALLGSQAGEGKHIIVGPERAYGVYLSDYLQELPREQFEGIELTEGMTLFGQGQDGQTVQVIVKDFNEERVVVDYNHPLAGKELEFEVVVLDVREATDREIRQGGVMAASCGNHNSHGGGCCGGSGHGGAHGCGCH